MIAIDSERWASLRFAVPPPVRTLWVDLLELANGGDQIVAGTLAGEPVLFPVPALAAKLNYTQDDFEAGIADLEKVGFVEADLKSGKASIHLLNGKVKAKAVKK